MKTLLITLLIAISINCYPIYNSKNLPKQVNSLELTLFPSELSFGIQYNRTFYKFDIEVACESSFTGNFFRSSVCPGFHIFDDIYINFGVAYTYLKQKRLITAETAIFLKQRTYIITPEIGIFMLVDKHFTFSVHTDTYLGYASFGFGFYF